MANCFSIKTPTNLYDNGYTTDQSTHKLCSPFSRWVFSTKATKMWMKTFNNIFSTFQDYAQIGIWVNHTYYNTLQLESGGTLTNSIDLPPGVKLIEIVMGLQTIPSDTRLGTFPLVIYFSGGKTFQILPEIKSNRVVIYGDSISGGGNATYPTGESWVVLLRQYIDVVCEGWGYRSLHADANTQELRQALVSKLTSYMSNKIWISIGTNDFGLNKWSSNDFGVSYSALVNDIHSASPNTHIYCQTPTLRNDENTENDFGNTIDDYRQEIINITENSLGWTTLVNGTEIIDVSDTNDGLHPNDSGHIKYFNYVSNYFK